MGCKNVGELIDLLLNLHLDRATPIYSHWDSLEDKMCKVNVIATIIKGKQSLLLSNE